MLVEYTLSEHEARHIKELEDAIVHHQTILAEVQRRIVETVASHGGSLKMIAVQHGIMAPGGDGNKVAVKKEEGNKITISGDPIPPADAPTSAPPPASESGVLQA